MGGTSLALSRWQRDGAFYRQEVIRGRVLDIGHGHDPLSRYAASFPLAGPYTCIDHQLQDARHAAEWLEADAEKGLHVLGRRTFDLVYSSHCLEHVWNPSAALKAWWERVAPGGHLLVIVPSWVHYERCVWPPRVNTDHKTAWLLEMPSERPLPFIRGLLDEVKALAGAEIRRAQTLDAGFRSEDTADQTANGTCECGHEVVARKAP